MNPKNVWGIILIVLGILFVLSGINDFQAISLVENEITLLNRAAISFLGKSNSNLFGIDNSIGLLRSEKIKCVLSVLLGIAGAFFGTLMLKGRRKNKSLKNEQYITHYDSLQSSVNDNFTLGSKEDKPENDHLRWMHPDMREEYKKNLLNYKKSLHIRYIF